MNCIRRIFNAVRKRNFSASWFHFIMVTTLLSTFYLTYHRFFIQNPVQTSSFDWSHWGFEMMINLVAMFEGRSEGFKITLSAYFIFVLMAVFFIASGKVLFNLIFIHRHHNGPAPATDLFERYGLYYLLGSLIASAIWFALSSLGWINVVWAQTLLGIGLSGLLSLLFGSRIKSALTFNFLSAERRQAPLSDMILAALLIVYLASLSSTAFRPPLTTDSLNIHASIPYYYLTQGKLAVNPHHFYTYFTQNTEMLTLWAYTLGSEMAANLLVWGFLCSWIAYLFGFLRRQTNGHIALVTIFLLLSAHIVFHSTIQLKPDMAQAAFVFAHYCCLMEALNFPREYPSVRRSWVLLSGLLCGGAIAHKLSAMPVGMVSTAIIIANDICHKRDAPKRAILFPYLILGIALPVLPWFLRNIYYTGNPLYPFMTKFFNNPVTEPLYSNIKENLFQYTSGQYWTGSDNFFLILFKNDTHKSHAWGPSIFLALLCPLFVKKSFSMGSRLCVLAAALTVLLILANKNIEVRYMMGNLAFLVLTPFAFTWNILEKTSPNKIMNSAITLVGVYIFIQMNSIASRGSFLAVNLGGTFSGFTPGNFATTPDFDLRTIPWLAHIINTRSPRDGIILCAGHTSPYGLKKKFIFASLFNRDILWEIARNSSDAAEIASALNKQGITDIIIPAKFNEPAAYALEYGFKFSTEISEKLVLFFERYMMLRFQTPHNEYAWYSFKTAGPFEEFALDRQDAEKFPIMYLEEVREQVRSGNMLYAAGCLEEAVAAQMNTENKIQAYRMLIRLHLAQGDLTKAQKTLADAEKNLAAFQKNSVE